MGEARGSEGREASVGLVSEGCGFTVVVTHLVGLLLLGLPLHTPLLGAWWLLQAAMHSGGECLDCKRDNQDSHDGPSAEFKSLIGPPRNPVGTYRISWQLRLPSFLPPPPPQQPPGEECVRGDPARGDPQGELLIS